MDGAAVADVGGGVVSRSVELELGGVDPVGGETFVVGIDVGGGIAELASDFFAMNYGALDGKGTAEHGGSLC